MLLDAKRLEGYALRATDGEIGKVKDLYFDDRQWKVRYAVANTGNWLPGRKVLIAPHAMSQPDIETEAVPVSLTGEQIEASPGIDAQKPITQEYEEALHTYYNWPFYWTDSGYLGGFAGGVTLPSPLAPAALSGVAAEGAMQAPANAEEKADSLPPADRHLQSVNEVRGWTIEASDGELGHVEDVLVGTTDGWTIRQIVIDTRNWLPGRKVLVAPNWISYVDWKERKITVKLDQKTIEEAPAYDADKPLDPEFETKLQASYQTASERS
jgi:uncharacterized protein YrrD